MALEKVVRNVLAAIPLVFLAHAGCGSCGNNDSTAKRTDYEKPVVEEHGTKEDALHQGALDPIILDFLENPTQTFTAQKIPKEGGLRAMILSNIAEGCANLYVDDDDLKPTALYCIERAMEIAESNDVSPYNKPILQISDLGNQGIYLSHYNIILGAWKRVSESDNHKEANEQVSKHLAKKTVKDPYKHMRSYSHLEGRWPADQTATLYSLWLYDQNYGTDISSEPIAQWLEYMQTKATDEKTGLPVSEVTGKWGYSNYPRGCALSWSVKYMARFAPEEAEKVWDLYKEHFAVDFVIGVGFREYPKGVERKGDVDSGPIIKELGGVGVAATGLAIGASNAIGDNTTYYKLKAVEQAGTLAAASEQSKELTEAANSIHAKAISFSNNTITAWY